MCPYTSLFFGGRPTKKNYYYYSLFPKNCTNSIVKQKKMTCKRVHVHVILKNKKKPKKMIMTI